MVVLSHLAEGKPQFGSVGMAVFIGAWIVAAIFMVVMATRRGRNRQR